MSDRPRILVLGADEPNALPADLQDRFGAQYELVCWPPSKECLDPPPLDEVRCVLLCGETSQQLPDLWRFDSVLRNLPQGVAVLDPESRIRWCNDRLGNLIGRQDLLGIGFLEAFGAPETVGPEFAPFHMSGLPDGTSVTTLHAGEKTYYEVVGSPVYGSDGHPQFAVVTVRDISSDMIVRQKLKAIYQAGLDLGELSAEDVLEFSADDRIELLKQKIQQFTKDVLEFETVEIRLLDKRTNELEPLLQMGMTEEASGRKLYASEQGNGVTGFVAARGESYFCADTSRDPRYLPGAPNAKSSLTVPLILHDQILGTFNCESALVGGFRESDLQFLELFCREVAIALNTLELLVAEKLATTTESTDLILKEIAQPIDEILNDTAWILERYIGHDPSVCERLQRVLKHTRGIRQLVHRVGETIAPKVPNPPVTLRSVRPKLRQKRVLVVDNDESVRIAAHELLGRFGCEVETAHHGEEALLMVRSFHYDVVIVDIRLPDMTGYDCFVGVRQLNEHLPVILMTGFGYDPSHSIVKARQAGLKSVLYKPFRLDQLLKEVETAVTAPGEAGG